MHRRRHLGLGTRKVDGDDEDGSARPKGAFEQGEAALDGLQDTWLYVTYLMFFMLQLHLNVNTTCSGNGSQPFLRL